MSDIGKIIKHLGRIERTQNDMMVIILGMANHLDTDIVKGEFGAVTTCNIVGGDCENPAAGKDCGDYGNNCCEDCYTSYTNGEFEPDFNHPDEGRDA